LAISCNSLQSGAVLERGMLQLLLHFRNSGLGAEQLWQVADRRGAIGFFYFGANNRE